MTKTSKELVSAQIAGMLTPAEEVEIYDVDEHARLRRRDAQSVKEEKDRQHIKWARRAKVAAYASAIGLPTAVVTAALIANQGAETPTPSGIIEPGTVIHGESGDTVVIGGGPVQGGTEVVDPSTHPRLQAGLYVRNHEGKLPGPP